MSDVACELAPVPRRLRRWALEFVAGGRTRTRATAARADALRQIVAARAAKDVWLWWARRWRRCLAAAMVVANPGKTALLYHSPSTAPGVRREAMSAVIEAVSRHALETGDLSLVQSLHSPGAHQDIATVADAGYEALAELLYLRRDLNDAIEAWPDEPLAWRRYDRFSEAELAEVISQTYEDSLDCPVLHGRRAVADVIAGHKSSGVFWPEGWWMVSCDGRPTGCVLVNRSADRDSADVVYLGVTKVGRGRGVGRALVRHAATEAMLAGCSTLTLAVDAENHYARSIYEGEGFLMQGRKTAYVMLRGCPSNRGVH